MREHSVVKQMAREVGNMRQECRPTSVVAASCSSELGLLN